MRPTITALKNHAGFRKYFANTSWLFGEKILRMIVGVWVAVWVARYLGPEQFGLFSYAQSFVGLFTAIATLGLENIVVRELVKDENRRDELIGTAFWLKIIGASFVLCVLAIAVLFTSNDHLTNWLIFIVAGSMFFQAFNVVDFYFQAKVISRYVVFANAFSLIISSIIKITLIMVHAPLIAFAWMVLFDSIILASGFIYFFIKTNPTFSRKNLKFKSETAVALLKASWPLILSGIAVSVYVKIDQVMIKEMLGNEAVGQYAAAVRLSEVWYFIPGVIVASLFPAIINAKAISEELYYQRMQSLYNLMVLMAISIALPITFLSEWIINVLYGNEYIQSNIVLKIHIWAGVFVFLGGASGKWLVVENLQKIGFYRTFIGAILNLLGNYFLIPIYGIVGAAYTTVFSYAAAGYFYDFFNTKTRNIFYMKTKSFNLITSIKSIFHPYN